MVAGQSSMAGVCLFQAVVLVALLSLVAADEIVISLDGDKWLLSDSSGRVKGLQACSTFPDKCTLTCSTDLDTCTLTCIVI